ncbi:hypothetical protein F2P45_34115 [Massilia sp. CCM 8733]|uniref:Uncharacterized protein n=1 Tax=Massilia mucilaginosa TaxID=2609282 RepID=A0ABX0P5G1_9BURK|nr:hypothetical protein [Massilia mucilaginosa]
MNDNILGIVHGVMPAIGAGAAYKRMRCGFEDSLLSITPKILGNFGEEVTAVLGNAQGGLELLPNQAYGNRWLEITHDGRNLKSLPQKGDPYEEIYKLRDRWYSLFREEWINPARLGNSSFSHTCDMLDDAKQFHNEIAETYHSQSYAHYGADASRNGWHVVRWNIEGKEKIDDLDYLQIVSDNRQGKLTVRDSRPSSSTRTNGSRFIVNMQPAADAGDQTVRSRSLPLIKKPNECTMEAVFIA